VTIFRYAFETTDEFELSLPLGARILTVQAKGDAPSMWAMVNEAETVNETRHFRVYGTGHPIEVPLSHLDYLGTYQLRSALVFHVFEVAQ
jgi:hypothetical protein